MAECFLGGVGGGGSVRFGAYTGNGRSSRFIELGVSPKWVLVAGSGVFTAGLCGLVLAEAPISLIDIAGTGFYVYQDTSSSPGIRTNQNGVNYTYLYGT